MAQGTKGYNLFTTTLLKVPMIPLTKHLRQLFKNFN